MLVVRCHYINSCSYNAVNDQVPVASSWLHKRCFTFSCRASSVFLATLGARPSPAVAVARASPQREKTASAELETLESEPWNTPWTRTARDVGDVGDVLVGTCRRLRWRCARSTTSTMKLLFVVTLLWREALCGSPSVQIGRILLCAIASPLSSVPFVPLACSSFLIHRIHVSRPSVWASPIPPVSVPLSLRRGLVSLRTAPILSTFLSYICRLFLYARALQCVVCVRGIRVFVFKVLTGTKLKAGTS